MRLYERIHRISIRSESSRPCQVRVWTSCLSPLALDEDAKQKDEIYKVLHSQRFEAAWQMAEALMLLPFCVGVEITVGEEGVIIRNT